MTDASLRTTLITLVKRYVSSGINSGPFPDRYNSANGQMATFTDRTVVGGHFALVRLFDVFLVFEGLGTDFFGLGFCLAYCF